VLSETVAKIAKSSVAATYLNILIQGLPILVERDSSLGPETPVEHMIRKILETKIMMEQQLIVDQITLIRMKKGQKLHNLFQSFNIVV